MLLLFSIALPTGIFFNSKKGIIYGNTSSCIYNQKSTITITDIINNATIKIIPINMNITKRTNKQQQQPPPSSSTLNEIKIEGNMKETLLFRLPYIPTCNFVYSITPLLPNGLHFDKQNFSIYGNPQEACQNKKCNLIISNAYDNSTINILYLVFNINPVKIPTKIIDIINQNSNNNDNKRKADDNISITSDTSSYTYKKRRIATNINKFIKKYNQQQKQQQQQHQQQLQHQQQQFLVSLPTVNKLSIYIYCYYIIIII